MAGHDIFAKRRQRIAKAGEPDIHAYAPVPPLLRRQIRMLMEAAMGPWYEPGPYDMRTVRHGNSNWSAIANTLEREVESFPGRRENDGDRVLDFIAHEQNVDNWLSAVELFGLTLLGMIRKNAETCAYNFGATQIADSALKELNVRFRESGFGYQFENGEIVRVDDQYVHAEVVKPVLALLAEPGFEKANEEFMTAHKHYRTGDTKDAVVAANRAFESTLRAICEKKAWKYEKGARAGDLVSIVRKVGLFPPQLDSGLDTYVAMMKTGLPGFRNQAGGHGESPSAPRPPDYFASYAIHLTASNILLAINVYRELQ